MSFIVIVRYYLNFTKYMQTKIIRILYLMFKLCMCIEVQNGFFLRFTILFCIYNN